MTPNGRHSGYTLLELSVVVIIIGLVVTMGQMGWGIIESATRTSTNRKLDQIEEALMQFRTANNRLPCPADATLLETDVNYGIESVNNGSCITGSVYDPTTGIRSTVASPGPTANYFDAKHDVVEGAIPFKTLNLPKEFMYDGWKRKFAYAVNYLVTGSQAMKGQPLNESCHIAIADASGNPRTTGALYALVSYGEAGHGGYLSNGTRLNAASANSGEQTNCHCDNTAAETTYASSYVAQDRTDNTATPANSFDNIVRFKDRWQMMTYDDQYANGSSGPLCQFGFRIDGNPAADNGLILGGVGDFNGDGIPDILLLSGPQSLDH